VNGSSRGNSRALCFWSTGILSATGRIRGGEPVRLAGVSPAESNIQQCLHSQNGYATTSREFSCRNPLTRSCRIVVKGVRFKHWQNQTRYQQAVTVLVVVLIIENGWNRERGGKGGTNLMRQLDWIFTEASEGNREASRRMGETAKRRSERPLARGLILLAVVRLRVVSFETFRYLRFLLLIRISHPKSLTNPRQLSINALFLYP
jgi:hypothetical protein